MVGITIGIAAIFLSVIYCLFWLYTVNTWSLREILSINAYVMGEFMLTWSPETYHNTTSIILNKLFEDETATMNWTLGIPAILTSFFGRLQDSVVSDVVLLIALSLYQTMKNFIHILKTNHNEDDKREETWRQYEFVKSLAQQINDLFGFMIIIIHLYNALTISNFLLEGLKKGRKARTILLGITSAKVTLIYLIACMTSQQVRLLLFLTYILSLKTSYT